MIRPHWTSYIFALITVACIGYGEAQVQDAALLPALQPPPPGYFPSKLDGYIPPDRRQPLPAPLPQHAIIKPEPELPKLVVLRDEKGGLIDAHRIRFAAYEHSTTRVEVHGSCLSACTLITAYVPKDRLCFAPGAFLAFHAAWNRDYQTSEPRLTLTGSILMYISYPEQIRHWLDAQGGPTKLTVKDWWVLYDRDLWRMGYPRCP